MGKPGEGPCGILRDAIKQERDGIQFYTDAAARSRHHLGKAMFTSFAGDEKEHLNRLEKLLKVEGELQDDLPEIAGMTSAKERLLSVFGQMKDGTEYTIHPEADDIDALKIAIEIEKNGHKLYEKACSEADDTRIRELFKFLAKEEIIHYEILRNTYNYLDGIDKLHAKEEDRGYDLWVRMINEI